MSKQINQSIIIDAKVRATLEGMNQVVSELNKGLREGATKIDLTKGIGNSVSKQIEVFKTEYQKFANLAKGGKIEFIDTKEAVRSGEQMIKTFTELRRIVGNFEELSVLDAKRMFPDAFDSRVDNVRKNFIALRNSIVELDAKKLGLDQATTELSNLQAQQEALKQSLATAMSVEIDTEGAERDLEKATEKVKNLREELEKTLNAKLGETEVLAAELSTRKETILKARAARGAKSAPETLTSARARGASAEELEAIRKAQTLYNQEEKELKEIEDALKKNADAAKDFRKAIASADKATLKKLAEDAKASSDKFKEINAALDEQATAQARVNEVTGQATEQKENIARIKEELDETTASIEKQETKVGKLKTAYETLKSKVNPEALTKAFKEIGIDFTPEMARNEEAVLALQKRLNELDEVSHQKLIKSLNDMGLSADSAEDFIKQLRGELGKVGSAAEGIAKNAQEIENLKNQVLQFFSITNSIQLFKRAITSAMSTVKELDATMTEAAVVTDFSIGDMWDKLPEYSAQAKALGVSINGMYQATTLYYQQGLKNNAAMALGIETMKMAKIAGIDSANATKAMTSALRGFNMELNETSAQKVNDVYSQLAAVTAADTNQIATAMEKTASIAAAANMEFETTAAFLAQIIETTQEAPETAGTALKTIIARFAEVKSLREQGLSSGQDDEGEIIDVNKIQTALRTVGISMDGFFAGTEGLDDVLLKLSEKWGSLDFETQRYIATMAAGSRQQSRFIAMMSDYGRTAELVSEANNSAGASQKQYEKTLDSLETKLQNLKTAWEEFTMGLANNEILKMGVDLLTNVLNTINDITEAISGGNGLAKSITSLVTVIGALKLGRNILTGSGFNNLFSNLTGQQETQAKSGGRKDSVAIEGGVIKNPTKQGWGAGTKAGNGFIGGFAKAVKDNKAGEKSAKSFFKTWGKETIGAFKTEEFNSKEFKEAFLQIEAVDGTPLANLQQQLKENKITAQEAARQYEALGANLDDLNINLTQTAPNFQALGSAALGAGAAFGLLATYFEDIGWEEGAEAVSTLSTALMILGGVFTVLGPIVSNVSNILIAKGIAVQAAWWWILVIVAAVGAIIGVFAALFKPKDDDLEKQLESINNQIEQMSTAADEAASSLDKLTEARDELADMQNVFKGLVKGTDDWRKALVESNAKVLELLNTYPELANYIVTDENGLMSIGSAGWEKVIEQQSNAVVSSQASAAALQAKKIDLEKQSIRRDSSLTELEKQAKLIELEAREKTQMQAYYTTAISGDKYLAGSKYAQSAANVLAYDSAGEINAEISSQEIQADGKDFSDSQKDSLKKSYAELTGKTVDEVSKLIEDGLTYKDINTAVAADKVTKKKAKDMKEISMAVARAGEKDQKVLEKLLTRDGKGLRKADVEDIQTTLIGYEGATSKEQLDSYLKEKGITLEQDQLNGLINALNNAATAFGDEGEIVKALQVYGLDGSSNVKEFVTSMEYGTGYELAKKLGDISADGATEAEVSGLVDSIKNALAGLEGDDLDMALAYLADTNWDSKESIADMVEFLRTFDGLDEDALESLGDTIVELSDAISENTTAQLREKGWSLQEILDQILSGEMKQSSLTGKQKDALLSAGLSSDDFVQIGLDTWAYTGDLYSKVINLYGDVVKNQGDPVKAAQRNYDRAVTVKGYENEIARANQLMSTGQAAFMLQTMDGEAGTAWRSHKRAAGLEFESQDDEVAAYVQWASTVGTEQDAPTWAKQLQGTYTDWAGSGRLGEGINKNMQEAHEEVSNLYQKMAEDLGITPQVGLTTAQMIEWINKWNELYGNLGTFESYLKDAAKDSANTVLTNTGLTTSEIGYQKFENSEAQEEYGKAHSAALEQRVKITGGAVFIDDIANAVKGAGGKTEKFTDAINALASDMAVISTKTKKFAENMSGLADVLSGNKNSPEYGKALEQAKANVKDYFGVDDNAIAEIPEELYARLAKGDPKALDEMQAHIGASLWGSAEKFQTALASIKPNITPTYDAEGLAQLAYDLGIISDNTVTGLTDDVLKQLTTKLSTLEVDIAFQHDATTGVVTGAVTTTTDRSNLFSGYVPKKPKASKFQNTLDKQYNTYEKINALLRERERIERRYDKLLESRDVSGKKLLENTQEQLANLKKEEEYQKGLQAAKKAEIQDLLKKNATIAKRYGVSFDYNSGAISVNWSKLNSERNATRGEKGLDLISSLEGLRDQWDEAGVELENIEDAVDEIRSKGREDYLSFEQKVRDALIDSRQKEVDALNEINDSINDANSKMLESMQRQIDEYRQTRDNEKTEQDIEDKQRRLAYLQQDTSGANALEIMRLEKEIGEAQESYTDQLIDQKISELQKQNDEAAEQRERQIQLMEASNKLDEESGRIWEEVHKLIREGRDENKALNWESKLANLLKQFAGFEAMSETEKNDWTEETSKEAAEAYKGLDTSYAEKGEKVTFTEGGGRQVEGISNGEGKVTTDSGLVYTNVHYDEKRNLVTDYTTEEAQAVYDEYLNRNKKGYIASLPRKTGLTKAQIKNLQRGLNALRADGVISFSKALSVDGVYGKNTKAAVKALQKKIGSSADGVWGKNTYDKFHGSGFTAYKTGGLADFTGPAWLDGTKARPEYVLNADQTKAFFQLVDVLSGLERTPTNSTQNNGDINLDIDINVETINDTADLDMISSYIEEKIVSSANYRNNNVVGRSR